MTIFLFQLFLCNFDLWSTPFWIERGIPQRTFSILFSFFIFFFHWHGFGILKGYFLLFWTPFLSFLSSLFLFFVSVEEKKESLNFCPKLWISPNSSKFFLFFSRKLNWTIFSSFWEFLDSIHFEQKAFSNWPLKLTSFLIF